MELETVLYRVEGNVGIVSMNRTKALNAMNEQIFVDLTTAFNAAEADVNVRVIIVNAEGRAFCAGGDIAEMKQLDDAKAVFDFYNIAGIFMKKMMNCPKPVITAAHGAIAGAGTSLLLAGDFDYMRYAIRQDITYKILDQATITDAEGRMAWSNIIPIE